MPYKDPEKRKAYRAAYHVEHRKEENALSRAYNAARPERTRARLAAWRAAHPEKVATWNAAWRAANPGKIAARMAAYRASPFGKASVLARNRRRRAQKKSNTPQERMLTAEQWLDILFRSKGKCYWCGKKRKPTIDHVIPLSKGGRHVAENVVVACKSCNCKKHAKILTLL